MRPECNKGLKIKCHNTIFFSSKMMKLKSLKKHAFKTPNKDIESFAWHLIVVTSCHQDFLGSLFSLQLDRWILY